MKPAVLKICLFYQVQLYTYRHLIDKNSTEDFFFFFTKTKLFNDKPAFDTFR